MSVRVLRCAFASALAFALPACEADGCIKTKVSVAPADFARVEDVVLTARVTTSQGEPVPYGPVRFLLSDTSAGKRGRAILNLGTETDGNGVAEASFANALNSFAGRRIFDVDQYTVEFGHDVMPLNACRSKASASFHVDRG